MQIFPTTIKCKWPLVLMAMLSGLFIAARFGPETGYYINYTASVPVGLYRMLPADDRVKLGELVFMEVPEHARPYAYGRGWLPEGALLIKRVGGVPGDKYAITDTGLSINGRFIGPVFEQDREGKPLPKKRGTWRIKQGYFLPVATGVENSFDGRYFGAVPVGLIRGKAIPVLIWK